MNSITNLSVIIPFFHKVEELDIVFPMNKPYLIGAEVVLCLDEADSAESVSAFVKKHPEVKWTVIVNRLPHMWRTPCKAINVGLKHISNEYVLVVSPESKFVGNLPEMMLSNVSPSVACTGTLVDCYYPIFLNIGESNAIADFKKKRGIHYYGSICFHRQAAINIGGYDECMSKWGGDDDNFRARLRLSGVRVDNNPQISIVHLTFDNNPKAGCQMSDLPPEYIHCPKTITCPRCYSTWGTDFSEILYQSI